jgi:hypothetical protein
MQKHVVNFVVVVLAVCVALFIYDQFRWKPQVGDFGAGELKARNDMVRDDMTRAMSSAKVAVVEFYLNRGAWPTSNEEAGLPSPDAYHGETLRKLEVTGNMVTLTYDAKSGVDGGQIIFTGDGSNPAMGVSWKCTSPNMSFIDMVTPACKYVPG